MTCHHAHRRLVEVYPCPRTGANHSRIDGLIRVFRCVCCGHDQRRWGQ